MQIYLSSNLNLIVNVDGSMQCDLFEILKIKIFWTIEQRRRKIL